MGAIASQITSLTIVYSTFYPGADQSKHQSSASLAFVWGIHRGTVNSPHKWPVTQKMFPLYDIIMSRACCNLCKAWRLYILKQSYLDVLQEPHLYNSSWYNHLMDLASRFQCSKQDPASKIRNIMERHYKELWLQSIQCNNKLRTFKRFKHEFKLENYLLHESLENRKNLTRLRISSHKLAVETGRYKNIALNERLCQLCECNAVEDEYHFVMNCPFYKIYAAS